MEILFELLYQMFGELLLQIFFLFIVEVVSPILGLVIKEKSINIWIAITGYVIFGVIAGLISLLFFPSLFIVSHLLQIVNLLVTPLAVSGLMYCLLLWRLRRGEKLVRLDHIVYSFVFALTMSAIRFAFAH
jgi:hypothetical protein